MGRCLRVCDRYSVYVTMSMSVCAANCALLLLLKRRVRECWLRCYVDDKVGWIQRRGRALAMNIWVRICADDFVSCDRPTPTPMVTGEPLLNLPSAFLLPCLLGAAAAGNTIM